MSGEISPDTRLNFMYVNYILITILPALIKRGQVRLCSVRSVIEQEVILFLIFLLQIERFFLVILILHSKLENYICNRQKTIVDLESTQKNTSIKIYKIYKYT